MPVIRKASSTKIIKKTVESAKNQAVKSTRQPSRLSEMGDTDFGTLGAAQDNKIVSYDSSTNKFILITADQILSNSIDNNDVPDDFVRELETELDLGQILDNLDGGAFWCQRV